MVFTSGFKLVYPGVGQEPDSNYYGQVQMFKNLEMASKLCTLF